MKFISKLFILLSASVFMTACSGGIQELAEKTLYPFADVNKSYPVPEAAPEGFKLHNFTIKSTDQTDINVNAWSYQPPNPSNRVYVHLHGNGENLQALYQFNFLAKMKEFNSNYIVIDYPGLGRSTGTPNQENLVNAALAAIDWAKQTYPQATLIVWGRSLGASVATLATARRQQIVQGLLLTSPWNNFFDAAKALSNLAGQIPDSWLNMNRYDSVEAAARINTTTLIHHGVADKLIPIALGRILFHSFPDPSNVGMVEIPGLGHNDIFTSPDLWRDLRQFIR